MDPLTVTFIVAIVGKVIEYGAPVVANFIAALNKEEITLEDIQGLYIKKEPDQF